MKKSTIHFWIFLAPVLIAFIMVMVIPFFLGAYYSLTDWNGIDNAPRFVGLHNFKLLFVDNPRWLHSTIVTFVYSVISIIIINIYSLSLALLVTQNLRFRTAYRAGFFLPNLIGGLILGYIWQFIFNNVIPLLLQNDFFMLSNRNTALLAIVIASTWQYGGYIMVVYVTAIQNIPREIMDGARIDGASPLQRMRYIVLPLLAPAFTITTFLTLLYSFKQFDVNFSLTEGGPSTMFWDKAVKGTEFISMNIFSEAFIFNNMALAQAKSVLFFLVLVVFSVLQVYFNKKKEVEF